MKYLIIGADGQHYGPVEAEELRRWIAEGRLNGQSLARREGDSQFQPLSGFAEFADALGPRAPGAAAPFALPAAAPARLPAGDYDLDIGACIAGGWNVVKSNFWPVVGVFFLMMIIQGVFSQITSLVTNPIIRPMIEQRQFNPGGILIVSVVYILMAPVTVIIYAGLYYYVLKLSRGQAATLADAFAGVGPSFAQLVLLSWVQTMLLGVGYLLCFIPGIYLAIAWAFAMPLVIDRKMGFWEAMELSRQTVNKHWFMVFAFLIVVGLLMLAGVLACCVGLLVTIPIGFASIMCAYQVLFPAQPTQ